MKKQYQPPSKPSELGKSTVEVYNALCLNQSIIYLHRVARPKPLESCQSAPRSDNHVSPRPGLTPNMVDRPKQVGSAIDARPKAFGPSVVATLMLPLLKIQKFIYNCSKKIFNLYFHLCLFNQTYFYLFYISFFYFRTLTTCIPKIHSIVFINL